MKNKNIKNEVFEVLLPDFLSGVESKSIPSPDDINEWEDYRERRLYVNYGVTSELIDNIGYYIMKFNLEDDKNKIKEEDRQPIKIFINTNGGDLDATLHVCDLMNVSKTPIITIGQNAYSAGGLLLIHGHKRYCYPNGSYLLHSGSFGVGGNSHVAFDTADFYKKQMDGLKEIVCSNTKITPEMYQENYRNEWYMDAEDMIKYGVVDKILTEII